MASIRPTFCLRLRLMALCLAAGALSLLTGCYSEFMGPAPGDLTLVAQQPGGSYRTGSIESTEYQVHFFWGIWSPKKTNSWETLSKGVKGRAADGAYDVRIETYMPWWHVFFFAWTGGIVDISGHTIKAETYKFSKSNADAGPGPGGAALPLFTTPPPPAPAPGSPAYDPSPAPPPPLVTGPADQPPPPAPRPGRAPVTDPTAPKPVTAP